MNEKLETIEGLGESILENAKEKDIEKEIEGSRTFC